MDLELSPLALEDLKEIARYTETTWGIEQTDLYLNQIYSAFEDILSDPDKHRKRDDLFEGCQMAPVGKHLIFYEQFNDKIGIVRVLHERMNFPDHF